MNLNTQAVMIGNSLHHLNEITTNMILNASTHQEDTFSLLWRETRHTVKGREERGEYMSEIVKIETRGSAYVLAPTSNAAQAQEVSIATWVGIHINYMYLEDRLTSD